MFINYTRLTFQTSVLGAVYDVQGHTPIPFFRMVLNLGSCDNICTPQRWAESRDFVIPECGKEHARHV